MEKVHVCKTSERQPGSCGGWMLDMLLKNREFIESTHISFFLNHQLCAANVSRGEGGGEDQARRLGPRPGPQWVLLQLKLHPAVCDWLR